MCDCDCMKEFDLRGNKYLVGVRCVTYQHEKFIKDALDGFAMQQTDFPFLVMLIDDASTDGTQDVINRYLEDNFMLEEDGVALKNGKFVGPPMYGMAMNILKKQNLIKSKNYDD